MRIQPRIPYQKTEQPIKIISGFPGVGKTHFFTQISPLGQNGRVVSDSDSSKFDKAHFPQNYMEHIETMLPDVDLILVSSHSLVRMELQERDHLFYLVYPQRELKVDYLQRYQYRGSPPAFLQLMESKWDDFIDECEAQAGCIHLQLAHGEYLSDCLPVINRWTTKK